jgi:hypothetical protein
MIELHTIWAAADVKAQLCLQGVLHTTIQSHGRYTAHLTEMLTANGVEAWRGSPNVDAAFPYDFSYGAGDRAAANRTEVAALLAVSILTSVRERLVAVSCDIYLGAEQLAAWLTAVLPCTWPLLAAACVWNVNPSLSKGWNDSDPAGAVKTGGRCDAGCGVVL